MQRIAKEEDDTAKFQLNKTKTSQKAEKSEAKLRHAEEAGKNLLSELASLKAKVEIVRRKKLGVDDLINNLDMMFDDEPSFMAGTIGQIQNFQGGQGNGLDFMNVDMNTSQELEFRITLLEHDLQSLQSENITLVQTHLKLKQEFRKKRSKYDDISTRLVTQEIAEVNRDIQSVDEISNKMETEIDTIKLKTPKSGMRTPLMTANLEQELADMQRDITARENATSATISDIMNLNQAISVLQKEVEEERRRSRESKSQQTMVTEKEAILSSQLTNRLLELTSQHSELYNKQRMYLKGATASKPELIVSKESLAALKKNNERLMSEVLRLNEVLREGNSMSQQDSSLNQDLSISRIPFSQQNQSFDSSFLQHLK